MKYAILLVTAISATSAFAECPPPPEITKAQDEILSSVRAATDERSARVISVRLWDLWAKAPDQKAQEMLDRGMQRRAAYDLEGAVTAFDELTAYCPDYAEGYNQRAFANFIRQDYEAALSDLDLAIERSPRHVAAIAGKALTLLGLERNEEAQIVLRQALALNPWLSERQFLIEEPGEEL